MATLLSKCRPSFTHTPFGRVPGQEPASEGGGLKALLDQQDGGVRVAGARVGMQVLLTGYHRLLTLLLIGLVTHPQEDLQ